MRSRSVSPKGPERRADAGSFSILERDVMGSENEHRNLLEKAITSLLFCKGGTDGRFGEPDDTIADKADGLTLGETDGIIDRVDDFIDEAAGKAFKISMTLGLIPGPIGFASILPEVVALTRLQIDLIYRIARCYDKAETVNTEIVLLILANVMGVAGGEALIRKTGTALVIRSANTRVMRALTRKIGTRVIDTAVEKAIGRWIPVVTAPLFGHFSRSLTRKIGREAKRILSSQELTVEGKSC
jgi:hypothetical protein